MHYTYTVHYYKHRDIALRKKLTDVGVQDLPHRVKILHACNMVYTTYS
jgi:hypothetical protein